MRLTKFKDFLNESESKTFARFKDVALAELDGLTRLPCVEVASVVGVVRNKTGMAKPGNKDLPVDLVDAVKEAIAEYFWSGIEPEWPSADVEKWWSGLSVDSFEFVEGAGSRGTAGGGFNPYQNKGVPFLKWKDRNSVPKYNLSSQ